MGLTPNPAPQPRRDASDVGRPPFGVTLYSRLSAAHEARSRSSPSRVTIADAGRGGRSPSLPRKAARRSSRTVARFPPISPSAKRAGGRSPQSASKKQFPHFLFAPWRGLLLRLNLKGRRNMPSDTLLANNTNAAERHRAKLILPIGSGRTGKSFWSRWFIRRRTSLASRHHRRRYDQSRSGAALQERPRPARVQGRSTAMVRKNHRIRRRRPALGPAGPRVLAVRRLARR